MSDPDGSTTPSPPKPKPEGGAPKENANDPGQGNSGQGGGLLDSLSGLRSSPGNADERLGAERDAISGLRVGQYVGGNVYNMVAGPAALRLYHLSHEDLDETREAFVRPVHYDVLSRDAGRRTITLLRGPAGCGKYALARALLLDARHRELYLLDPGTDLTRIGAADLQRGAGYILADLPDTGAAALTLFEVNRLETELRSQDCRLVLTAGSSVTPADAGLTRSLLEAGDQPTAAEVTAAHLGWRLGMAEGARVQRLLARTDVSDLLRERLSGTTATLAAELGHLLAEAAGAGTEDEVVRKVRDRLELRDGQSYGPWFDSLDDLARQCLAIGVAVFGGEAYESVAALSHDLQERLQVEETAENPDRPRNTPLSGSRRGRLAAIHATLVESEVGTRHGGARGQVVRFRDQGFASKVLELVWTEYDDIRPALPFWLLDCAVSDLPTVRVRAAVAAGTLTTHSFETIRAAILSPWAADERSELRDAAAIAVRVAAMEAGHAKAAYDLVRGWSLEPNPRLRASAARAWRVIFEMDGTEAAWALLHSLADSDEFDILHAIAVSMTEYMALEDGRYYRDALDLIDQWIRSGSHGPHRVLIGEVAFLWGAVDLVDRVPDGPRGAGHRTWPALLAAADRDSRRREEVAVLWTQVVNSPRVYRSAHEVLGNWALLVEKDPEGRAALARLLHVVCADRRTYQIIRKQAENWIAAGEGRGASLTGHEVLAHLEGRIST
ncbi:hypothetical protein QR77_09510 [Streptomyces sp. 150FB]|uniref:hypothetical protein n=1 Tax=Streptomyces sp. 150FB TaxID=1576605 RepID=UPI000589540F|nr:hypothetical protein [Streptomyces sp. 150FB]KIF74162.1 hypothetical protein QR77_09510 [Streptomyces sp. 150FB]